MYNFGRNQPARLIQFENFQDHLLLCHRCNSTANDDVPIFIPFFKPERYLNITKFEHFIEDSFTVYVNENS